MKEFYRRYILWNIPVHILSFFSVCLLITSFIIPPTGEISPSVLQGVAELFAFSTLYAVIISIEHGGSAKIKHRDTEVEITPKEKKEEL